MQIRKPVLATFRGKHNEMKSKALITLLDSDLRMSLKSLAFHSGVSYAYLKSRLGKWTEWKYVKRHVGDSNGKPCFIYSIAARGRHFVEDIIPDRELIRYRKDIEALRQEHLQAARALFQTNIRFPVSTVKDSKGC